MTAIAALPRRRAEHACHRSLTGRDNPRRFSQHPRPPKLITAELHLCLDPQSNTLLLLDCPIHRVKASPAYPHGPVAAAKSP
jgi:hypothetical protein